MDLAVAIRVAVDLMGSDSPPHQVFEAVLDICSQLRQGDELIVLARHDILPQLRSLYGSFPPAITFVTTEESIEMEESPLLAVRRKKNSSLAAGMRLLKEKKIDAFVSMGNTGALVATATLYLPMLPQIERPALLVMMPTEKGRIVVLDVGANIAPTPQHLVDYALLGSIYCRVLFKKRAPKIGLLNVGVEQQKGTQELKETYQLLTEKFGAQFYGNIEGREVFQGKIDILITDGFTGNVFLKTSEGISSFLADYLQNHFNIPDTIAHLHQQFNYSEHPGALLCGMDGLVIKCHGFSDRRALINGIQGAFTLARSCLLSEMKRLLH